jgi:hypothetical protein
MFSVQFILLFVVFSVVCVFLTPGKSYTQSFDGHSRLSLGRDLTYDGTKSISTAFVVTDLEGIDFLTCVGHCLSLSPQCAALLYSKALLRCILLKCHLNDRLTKDSTRGDDWVYWRNYQGMVYFFV